MRHLPLAFAITLLLAGCQPATTPGADTQGVVNDGRSAAFAFEEATVSGLQRKMTAGELSSHALVQAYLDRIAAIDKAGPALHAVIELNPDALKDADRLDAERKAGKLRGPLHGIPVLLKDNIDAVPMVNSAGSLALAEHRPKYDAYLVRKLRIAGAVILGKTNLSEWANFRSTQSSSGWSGRGGQTRNPYVLDRSPCGSSAGTGSAIAANLATVGIGTETDGSIICPAAVAGLVGLKPTVGLVSRNGIIPISISQDTAGPMTRSVADAAALLTAIDGADNSDAAASERPVRAAIDYTAHLNAEALKGARIGVVRKLMGFQPETDAVMEQAIAALKAAGATVVDAQIPTLGQWDAAELVLLQYEFKAGLNDYLIRSLAPRHSLVELIEFNQQHAREEMPHFGQDTFEASQARGPLTDKAYREARDKTRRLAGPQGIDAALRAQHLDALVAPAMTTAWPIDTVHGDHFTGAGYGPAAAARYPSLTVPMGQVQGLPVGMVFMGTAWSEPRLIELGYAFEQATKARKPPKFLPTVGVAKP
ncbi:MAG: amidase [Xanthomonadaceae bacterium]|nr:amidase [Xanthomonadaceae bacterium]